MKKQAKKDRPIKLRCFFGLTFPLGEQLSPLIDRLAELGGDSGARLVAPDNMHVTLKFLGSISQESLPEIRQLTRGFCQQHQAFELTCQGVGFFKNSIWVGIKENHCLTSLADKLDQVGVKLGLAPDTRNFLPHVTVARFPATAKIKLSTLQSEFGEQQWGAFQVPEIQLYRSDTLPEGARYTILESFSLGDGDSD